jgi:hypothetical protein
MQVIFKQKNIALKEHIFSLKIDILLPAHNNFMEVRLKKRVLSYRQRNVHMKLPHSHRKTMSFL